jgi:hypothetical protein
MLGTPGVFCAFYLLGQQGEGCDKLRLGGAGQEELPQQDGVGSSLECFLSELFELPLGFHTFFLQIC